MSDPLSSCKNLAELNNLLQDPAIKPKRTTKGGRVVEISSKEYAMNLVVKKFVDLVNQEEKPEELKKGSNLASRIVEIDKNQEFRQKLHGLQKISLLIRHILGNLFAKLKYGSDFSREAPYLKAQLKKALDCKIDELKANAKDDPEKLNDLNTLENEITDDINTSFQKIAKASEKDSTSTTSKKPITSLVDLAIELEKQASAGDPAAQYSLSLMYRNGAGVKSDPDRARSLEEAAKSKGFFKALFKDDFGNDAKVEEQVQKAAASGDEEAIVLLANAKCRQAYFKTTKRWKMRL